MRKFLTLTAVSISAVYTASATAQTVSQVASSSCSTSDVQGLSAQIIAQAACTNPDAFVEIPPLSNVSYDGTEHPYLEAPARDAFVAAANADPGTHLTVTSALRTIAEQYLLYQWYSNGQTCGIVLAAPPGNSNHETGLAFDTPDYNAWMGTLSANGFSWYGNADVVHFDYVGAGAVDERGADVKAFQELWNKNNPGDMIAEDGAWGPQTQARMEQSPAGGFPLGAQCSSPPPPPPTNVDGYIDSAGAHVVGWAADPNAGNTALNVDLYFGGAAGSGYGVQTDANISRPDVAATLHIGPDHGFDVATPRYYCDNAAHPVYAYGHDINNNAAELKQSPTDLTCSPTPVGPGILRHLTSPPVLTAWSFDLHELLAWMTTADRNAHMVGSDWPDTLTLGRTFDGAVWVVDGTTRRHVIDPASFSAWHFNSSDIKAWTATDAGKYMVGIDLPAKPFLTQEVGNSAVYVLDTEPPAAPTTSSTGTGAGPGSTTGAGAGAGGGSPIGAGGGSGSSETPSTSHGCACSVADESSWNDGWLGGALVMGAAIRRRRRRSV